MSILLTFPLGPHPPPSSVTKGELTSYGLRVRAAHLLRKVAEVYGPKYPGLLPRKYISTTWRPSSHILTRL
jgi:transcription initiation factor TFIID subunit 6